MNWITRFINNLFAPNYYVANVTQDHPTFSIPGPPNYRRNLSRHAEGLVLHYGAARH